MDFRAEEKYQAKSNNYNGKYVNTQVKITILHHVYPPNRNMSCTIVSKSEIVSLPRYALNIPAINSCYKLQNVSKINFKKSK